MLAQSQVFRGVRRSSLTMNRGTCCAVVPAAEPGAYSVVPQPARYQWLLRCIKSPLWRQGYDAVKDLRMKTGEV